MIIHIVQSGETAKSIANAYGISEEWLILENRIDNPNQLVPGESYVILFPQITHTVQEGDSLASIAATYSVTVMDLLRNNTRLSEGQPPNIGEPIIIRYEDTIRSKISVNSYTLPFIDKGVLRKTLPYLTYLTILSYEITSEGEVIDIYDNTDIEVIELSKEYDVVPIMFLPFPEPNRIEANDITHIILNNADIQERFISNVLTILRSKGYLGLNFDTAYIFPNDRHLFSDFINNFINQIKKEGFFVFNTLSTTSFELIVGSLYTTFDYTIINPQVDSTYILPFEMKTFLEVPTGSIPFNNVVEIVDFTNSLIPSSKLSLSMSSIGYIWELPYIQGDSIGRVIPGQTVLQLARDYGLPIQFDEYTQSAFIYFLQDGIESLILFKDARSIEASLELASENNIQSIALWSIMEFFPDLWLIINSQYEILKIL
ncbi:MAG: LysM peptidoglycan-binding domain-containing protein [Clostridiales bacterium]|nr:LysM peptidoglycan-binding domain-containing protein [Clostridiales bacterium]